LVNVWLTPECRSEHRFVGVRDYGKPVASENSVVGQLNKADKTPRAIDPFADFPRLHEIVAAGVPVTTAIALWNRMASELDRGPDYWWAVVRASVPSARSLQ
jgi:hypothetical protein